MDRAGMDRAEAANLEWIALKAETTVTAEPSRNAPGPGPPSLTGRLARFGVIGNLKYSYLRSLTNRSRWDLTPFHDHPFKFKFKFKGSETGELLQSISSSESMPVRAWSQPTG